MTRKRQKPETITVEKPLSGTVEILKREAISLDGWTLTEESLPGKLEEWLQQESESLLGVLLIDADFIDVTLPIQYAHLDPSGDRGDYASDGFNGPAIEYPLTIDVNLALSEEPCITHRYRLDELIFTVMEDCGDGSYVPELRSVQQALRDLADAMEDRFPKTPEQEPDAIILDSSRDIGQVEK